MKSLIIYDGTDTSPHKTNQLVWQTGRSKRISDTLTCDLNFGGIKHQLVTKVNEALTGIQRSLRSKINLRSKNLAVNLIWGKMNVNTQGGCKGV